ncbi:hypothetical protein IQ06DRAFT_290106 [Phaeosphaeriaceae sp. SRC1lsM3a]|nr:hypothetical protein IQ06DRAFT_290106 [Stagonospora sp. SRC1lsM3a]
MATTESSAHVNGNYAPQGYENSYATGASNFTPSQQPTTTQPAQQASAAEVPKDEVGWYFVEQYYTTLSKSPERLYLFYNKRSQYVSGVEEEKVNVCVGQKAINERIKGLDFKDTKVRVTNVDTQGSESNIVIQVIGEISNQGQPHRRFAQTFVLAEQTNGYFVLNDIFRYLAEEPEEEEELQHEPTAPAKGVQEPAPTAAVPEDASLNQSNEVANSEEDLTKVDEKLEAAQQESTSESVALAAATEQVPEEIEAPQTEEVPAAVSEEAPKATEAPAVEETAQAEKPKAPVSTPAPSAAKAAPVAMPSGPPKPAAPRTWASLAASAHKVATPVVTAPASQQVPAQAKSTTAAQPAAAAPAAAQTSAPRDPSPSSQGEATGWQTATGHKKEQSRAQNQGPAIDPDQKRAYIKNVYSQVEEGALRAAMTKFGEIEYLDVSRPKNCAFVDFKTPAAYQAAVAANPHTVNGIELKVEERRPRPEQFRGGFSRGGAPRGRGGVGQGPRGGFQPRGRGGPARGRGAPQEA